MNAELSADAAEIYAAALIEFQRIKSMLPEDYLDDIDPAEVQKLCMVMYASGNTRGLKAAQEIYRSAS